jgi:hypothetical protein
VCLLRQTSHFEVEGELMPHDKKGRLIEVGDHVKFEVCERYVPERQAWDKRVTIGRATSVTPGSETCNVAAVHLAPGYFPLKQETLTAKDTELVLKADGSEPVDVEAPAALSEAGRARVGVIGALALAVLALLAVPAFAAEGLPAFKPEAWTLQADTGLSALVLSDGQNREYAGAGVSLDGPYAGLAFRFRGEILGEQDGGRLDFSRPQSFRAVLLSAVAEKPVGRFSFAVSGGTTTSIEGGIGAPVDSHLWNAQGTVSARVKQFVVRARSGYDQALGSGYVGGAFELEVAKGKPVALVSYDYPFQVALAGRPRPKVLSIGARVPLFKAKLSELFK